jgi:hypothetical protein
MMKTLLLLVGTCVSAALPAEAYLDQEAVHALYQEGSFDVVIRSLERYMEHNPKYSREDSIFIAKHLAVVYAANPSTLDKGKQWMKTLLLLLPAATLIDMYVSGEIDRIFEGVRRDFVARQKSFGVETNRMVLPERPRQDLAAAPPSRGESPRPASQAKPEKSGGGWVAPTLIVGGVMLVAGGAYALFALQEPEPRVRRVAVTNNEGQ